MPELGLFPAGVHAILKGSSRITWSYELASLPRGVIAKIKRFAYTVGLQNSSRIASSPGGSLANLRAHFPS